MKFKLEGFNPEKSMKQRGLDKGGRVQKFIDREVLKLCEPLIPVDTHMMRRSGKLSTEIGSGLVKYSTPYVRIQYYTNDGSKQEEEQRGKLWFERMKKQHKKSILKGAKMIAGGRND